MLEAVERKTLYLAFAWVVALVATLGSLYYSEVRLFLPCELCWYQRIFMYPQAVILGLALWRQDFGVWPYSLALSLLGGSVSVLHLTQQWFPGLFLWPANPPCPAARSTSPSSPSPSRPSSPSPSSPSPWAFSPARPEVEGVEEEGSARPFSSWARKASSKAQGSMRRGGRRSQPR